MFSPFPVWARGGQAPLRAQAFFFWGRHQSGPVRIIHRYFAADPGSPDPGLPGYSLARAVVDLAAATLRLVGGLS